MAIKSYDLSYVENVAVNIGTMFEYATLCGYEPRDFWNMFVSSEVAEQIEKGNPRYLAGFSAIELLNQVLELDGKDLLTPPPFYKPTEYYWAGWALSQYQNYKVTSFYNISNKLTIEEVLLLYNPLHEADITKFFMVADEYVNVLTEDTNLKKIRLASGLSQKELAEKSLVSIRSIQMYEQRQNNINKAQVDILFRLSKTLSCNIEDLLEEEFMIEPQN